MPVTKSAEKALRKDKRRTIINKRWKKRIKKALKEAREKPTKKAYALACQVLDRAAKKKVIHKNKASRLKSRLAKLLKQTGSGSQKSPAKRVKKVKKRVD